MSLPLEKQVTSYEISMKLKELGVPQGESQFVWFKLQNDANPYILFGEYAEDIAHAEFTEEDRKNPSIGFLCDAFTLSELIAMYVYNFDIDESLSEPDLLAEDFIEYIKNEGINPQDIKL